MIGLFFPSCSQHAPCKRSSQNRGQSGPRSLRPQLTCHKHCKDTPHVDSLNVHGGNQNATKPSPQIRRVPCHVPDCFRLSPRWAFPLCDHWVCRRQRAELPPWISTGGGIFSSVKSSSFYACANQSPKHWSEVGHRDVRKDTVQTMKASNLVESMFVTT